MSITTAVLAKEKQMLHSVSVHTQRYNQACINSEFIYALAYVCLSRLECGRVFCWSRILQGGENVVECTGPPPPSGETPGMRCMTSRIKTRPMQSLMEAHVFVVSETLF